MDERWKVPKPIPPPPPPPSVLGKKVMWKTQSHQQLLGSSGYDSWGKKAEAAEGHRGGEDPRAFRGQRVLLTRRKKGFLGEAAFGLHLGKFP